jgi:hypothetical protein
MGSISAQVILVAINTNPSPICLSRKADLGQFAKTKAVSTARIGLQMERSQEPTPLLLSAHLPLSLSLSPDPQVLGERI